MTHLWFVNIDLEGESGGRSVEMKISAATSREALIDAISRVELQEGELFHTVHVGKPTESVKMSDVITDGLDFMVRHDAAFKDLANR